MAEMIPLCVECIHCQKFAIDHRCKAMAGLPNPINGQPIVTTDCGMMRIGCDCGREGKLFKPKGERQ